MEERIDINEFIGHIKRAKMKYPNAKVMSVGTGSREYGWCFVIFLKYNGEEIGIDIPIYKKSEQCECTQCFHNCGTWCDFQTHCKKVFGESDEETEKRLAKMNNFIRRNNGESL